MPGGSGSPPVTSFIFSCSSASALRRASAWAATMRSSTISFSDGLIRLSSILTPFISPLPESLTLTRPPPDVPSTSIWSSCACIVSILDLSSAAWFIRPRKSAMAHLSCAESLRAKLGVEAAALLIVFGIGWTPIVIKTGMAVIGREFRSITGIVRRRRQRHLALAYVHDLGPGKAREHGLHQGISAYAGLEFGLACLVLRSDRCLALFGRHHNHPAPVGPLRELSRQVVHQSLRGALLQSDLQPAVLAAHQPDVALERQLDAEVALLRGERDQILETPDHQGWRGWLRRRHARARIAGGGQRGTWPPSARGLDPRRARPRQLEGRGRRSPGRRGRRRGTLRPRRLPVVVERADHVL